MVERLQNHQAKRKGDVYGGGIALQSQTIDCTSDIKAAIIDGTAVSNQ